MSSLLINQFVGAVRAEDDATGTLTVSRNRYTDVDQWVWKSSIMPVAGNYVYTVSGMYNGKPIHCAFPEMGATILYTSEDLITWTARTMPSIQSILGYGGGWFVASHLTLGARSQDGVTWEGFTLPADGGWFILDNGATLLAFQSGGTLIYESSDGLLTVDNTYNLPDVGSWEMAKGNGIYLASPVGGDYIYWATSLSSWNTTTLPSSNSAGYRVIGFLNGAFYIYESGFGTLYQSFDCVTWTVCSVAAYMMFPSASTVVGMGMAMGKLWMATDSIDIYWLASSGDGVVWVPEATPLGYTSANLVRGGSNWSWMPATSQIAANMRMNHPTFLFKITE